MGFQTDEAGTPHGPVGCGDEEGLRSSVLCLTLSKWVDALPFTKRRGERGTGLRVVQDMSLSVLWTFEQRNGWVSLHSRERGNSGGWDDR